MELSDQQQTAVQYMGSPTLVVAGAGSGKTRTLTAKVAHLIELGYDSERIIAITFTNKAAEEMKNRLVKLTGMPIKKFPWVRTYHSACFQILKVHCRALGYTPPLQIFSTYQQQKIIKDIVVGRMNQDKKYIQAVASGISNAKNYGNIDDYFSHHPRVGRMRLDEMYKLYEEELKSKNAVDFDNILLLTRNLFRDHADIRKKYQDHFQFILCDEYQDTNNINEEITRLLMKNGNLFAVGDDWQSIYSFRMSNVDHFLSFKKSYKDAKIFRLEQNYRSGDEIVRIANSLIKNNEKKMDKTCFSDIPGGVVEIHEFGSDQEEATWVTRKVKSLREMGIPLNKMAVLYRTKFCSLSFEQQFRKYSLPYQIIGGKGFFERKEILDINCYLSASIFEKDDASFERIINIPPRGIGPGTLGKIYQMTTKELSLQSAARKALNEKMLPPKTYAALSQLLELIDNIRDMKPGDAIEEILRKTSYMDYIKDYSKDDGDFISRKENIEQLTYSASTKDTLLEYLEEASLIREDKNEENSDEKGCGVNLLTVHASKGLEFEVVFVAACEENLFPHWRSKDTAAGLEEERRLMYVSMTRAERFLFLSCAGYRKGQYSYRSSFLDEIEAIKDR